MKIINTLILVLPFLLVFVAPIFQGPSTSTLPLNYVTAGFILLIVTIYYFVRQFIKEKNDKIKELEQVIERGYLSLTEEYNDISQYRYRKVQVESMRAFVKQTEYVPAVQIYEYSVSKTHPLQTRVNLNYVDGYVDEGEEINALISSQYNYNKGELRRLERAIKTPKPKKLATYMAKWRNELNKIPNRHSIKEQDVLKFSLLQVSMDYASRMALSSSITYLNNQEREQELQSFKKTGIARAIISNEFFDDPEPYHFNYTGSLKRKTDRIYTCLIREGTDGFKYLYLISLQIDNGISKKQFNSILIDTEKHFEQFLYNRKLVYNKSN